MGLLILFNKPFQVLCQFSPELGKKTLADFIQIPEIYPAGRLDYDSEGLVVLTDLGWLQHLITDPQHKLSKTYLVQVEGTPDRSSLERLRSGVELKDGLTKPAEVEITSEPDIWPRVPPIRERKNVATTWLKLTLREGRNRQVRRMTSAVGHPTLRLIRYSVGEWNIEALPLGTHREAPIPMRKRLILDTNFCKTKRRERK